VEYAERNPDLARDKLIAIANGLDYDMSRLKTFGIKSMPGRSPGARSFGLDEFKRMIEGSIATRHSKSQ
jgi:hypothetical protein